MSVQKELELIEKWNNKRANAQRRGIKFDLTLQTMKNLMRAKKCFYTGMILTEPRPGQPLRATDRTIDRVNCDLGYVSGNVVCCSHAANSLKAQVEKGGVEAYKVGIKVFTKAAKRLEKEKK